MITAAGARGSMITMASEGRDLFEKALQLPLADRARLAGDLLESLEDAETDADSAWAAEIQRRVDAIRAGEVGSTDWRTVLDLVEKDVLSR